MVFSWEAQREKQELSHQNYVKINAFMSPCPRQKTIFGIIMRMFKRDAR